MPKINPEVDAYIALFPPKVQRLLKQVRRTVRAAAPDATEVISYKMPALRGHGMIVYYAAFKSHIGLYPPIRNDAALEKAVKPYAGPKGNLQFPYDQEIPYKLITRVVKNHLKRDAAKARLATTKRRRAH
jgi:uncharacterized protein YdhG (YjbR/CyaY superfamily)